MRITRRDFLKYCAAAAGALGLTTTDLMKLEKALATPVTAGGTQVVWLNGAACTGCTVSLANTAYYSSIQDLLVPWTVAAPLVAAAKYPTAISTDALVAAIDENVLTETGINGPLDMVFMETLQSAVGHRAINAAKTVLTANGGTSPYVLCIEGAIQTNSDGNFCKIGNGTTAADETTITFMDEVLEFARDINCLAILAVGTCASFGGIPAGKGSVTGARGLISTGAITGGYTTGIATQNQGLWDMLGPTGVGGDGTLDSAEWTSLMRKTVCVSGCPPHPDWIVGTIVYILTYLEPPLCDKWHRPLDFYGQYQCTNCLWRVNEPAATLNGDAVTDINNQPLASKGGVTYGNSPKLFKDKYNSAYEGCLGILGCKGRKTKADCSYRRWNADAKNGAGTGWCVQTRAGCHGCTEPRFPDGWGKFFSYK